MSSPTTSRVAKRLIADGRRPMVLGVVEVEAVGHLADALFDVLANLADGADGIDLRLPMDMGPVERCAAADQLAEASAATIYLRSDLPMAAGQHTLILPADQPGRRPALHAVTDIGLDRLGVGPASTEVAEAWPSVDDPRRLLLSTTGFDSLDDAALMGLVTAAAVRGLAAVSTHCPRVARRVVDTLAPVVASGGTPTCL